MTQRVALVAPPMDFLRELYGFRGARAVRNQPPLGIGYIAGTLREAGIDVRIVDAAAHGWDHATTVEQVLAGRPDVIGITAITLEAPSAFTLVRALRPRTDAPLVLGGAHANARADQVPDECPELDAVVVGDGEPTMLALCRAVAAGRFPTPITGARVKRATGRWTPLRERAPVTDLDALPPPAYDLFPHHRYEPLPHRRRRLPATCVITARGCSYAECTYCEMSSRVRRRFRRHSPARAVADVRQLVGLTGARELYVQDDIFVTDAAWVEEFCDRLAAERLDLNWSCESRFVGVDEALLTRMRRAGCWRIYYGFEAGDQGLLDRIRKGFTLDEARAAARQADRAGLEVVGFFMLGLPGETPALGRRTVDFALELPLAHAMFSLTVPHAGTELHAICAAEGTILDDHGYHAKQVAYLPAGYDTPEQLQALQAEAYRRFYLRPGFVWSQLRRVRGAADLGYLARGVLALTRYLD